MGVFEFITHKEEIEDLLNKANYTYNRAKQNLEKEKKRTNKLFNKICKVKIKSWACDLNECKKVVSLCSDFKFDFVADDSLALFDKTENLPTMINNITSASTSASEILSIGTRSLSAGAIAGIASYSGVSMFGKASTGTSISKLSGIAKTNATLAWFGGGSLASGGLGMKAGKIVLAGIVITPIITVASVLINGKANAKLEEAKRIHQESIIASEQINALTNNVKNIYGVANKHLSFIKKLSSFLKKNLKKKTLLLLEKYSVQSISSLDLSVLSREELEFINTWCAFSTLYYETLCMSLLNDDGELDLSSEQILLISIRKFKLIKVKVKRFKII